MKQINKYHIIIAILVIIMVIFIDLPVNSLPIYTARSGRICDNCHITPFKNKKQDEWPNPTLAKRKCNLSCLSCHVSPGGGGIRNVVGRYYANNTLPMFWALNRPWHDRLRNFDSLDKMFEIISEDEAIRRFELDITRWTVKRTKLINLLQSQFIKSKIMNMTKKKLKTDKLRKKNIQLISDQHREKAIRLNNELSEVEKQLLVSNQKIRATRDKKRAIEYGNRKEKIDEEKSKDDDIKTIAAKKTEYTFSKKKNAKRNIEEHHKPHFYYAYDTFAFGYPLNASSIEDQSQYAFARERYGYLNADPLLMFGADVRPTALSRDGRAYFFPMQVELGTAIHPIEHLTFSATGALQGRKKGIEDSTRAKLQNAFVMVHELPLMTYVQAGLFLPSYGIRHDDHTAPGRKYLDMDPSVERNIVLGAEVGIAPNYPYFSFALFKNRKTDDPYKFTGYGMSLTAGWRDLLWGAGISLIQKKRDFSNGGNLKAAGINGYFNLGRIKMSIPLVIQAEANIGQKKKNLNGENKIFMANYLQVNYILVNGLDFKAAYHYLIDDLDLKIDDYVRYIIGVDYNIIYGVKVTGEIRYTMTASRQSITDFLLFFHLYL